MIIGVTNGDSEQKCQKCSGACGTRTFASMRKNHVSAPVHYVERTECKECGWVQDQDRLPLIPKLGPHRQYDNVRFQITAIHEVSHFVWHIWRLLEMILIGVILIAAMDGYMPYYGLLFAFFAFWVPRALRDYFWPPEEVSKGDLIRSVQKYYPKAKAQPETQGEFEHF